MKNSLRHNILGATDERAFKTGLEFPSLRIGVEPQMQPQFAPQSIVFGNDQNVNGGGLSGGGGGGSVRGGYQGADFSDGLELGSLRNRDRDGDRDRVLDSPSLSPSQFPSVTPAKKTGASIAGDAGGGGGGGAGGLSNRSSGSGSGSGSGGSRPVS